MVMFKLLKLFNVGSIDTWSVEQNEENSWINVNMLKEIAAFLI